MVITARALPLPRPLPSGLSSVVSQPLQLPANEPEASVMRLLHHLMRWNSLGGRGDGVGGGEGRGGGWLTTAWQPQSPQSHSPQSRAVSRGE